MSRSMFEETVEQAVCSLPPLVTVDGTDSLVVAQGNNLYLKAASELLSVKDFGATGNGTTDDTAAFAAALAIGKPVLVPRPSVAYIVGDLTVPTASVMIGEGTRWYNPTSAGLNGNCTIRRKAGCTSLLILNDRTTFRGLIFDGVLRDTDLIKPAAAAKINKTVFDSCGIYFFDEAVGGVTEYMGTVELLYCNIAANNVGIRNLVDSTVIGCSINANKTRGAFLGTGANNVKLISNFIEWNEGEGLYVSSAVRIVVENCIFDRNYGIGYRQDGGEAQMLCCHLRRNGRNGGSTYHALINGVTTFIGTNITTGHGRDDDGVSGSDTPTIGFRMQGSNGTIILNSADLTGVVTTAYSESGFSVTYQRVRDCRGHDDITVG